MKASTLVSTVGISMLGNIGRSAEGERLRQFVEEKNWPQVARELRKLSPSDKICGAEINSIASLCDGRRPIENNATLYFLVSDTQSGKDVGEILRHYYAAAPRQKVEVVDVHGLNNDAHSFRTAGLKNLVREIASIAKKSGGFEHIALNPLGGYKAAIAVAGIIGQAVGIPVYYKSEFFDDQVIVIPQMPIAFDDSIFVEHAGLLSELEGHNTAEIDADEIGDDRLMPFIEVEQVDDRFCATLTFVGEIFLQGIRTKIPVEANLPAEAAAEQRKRPTFRDDNYPDGFKDFVYEVWEKTPYITSIHSVDYGKQRSIRHRRFDYRAANDAIVGGFVRGFGARFAILTTAKKAAERTAVIQHLNETFGES